MNKVFSKGKKYKSSNSKDNFTHVNNKIRSF